METTQQTLEKICQIILKNYEVDAIYLYGSRAKGNPHAESDWDIAILFKDFIKDKLNALSRPQEVEALVERELKLYNKISLVDLELVPPPLQYNIIQGVRFYDRGVPHVRRVEHGIISTIEKDYDSR